MFWSGSSIIIKNTSSCEDPWFHFTYSYQSLRRTPLAPHEVTSKKDVRFAENGSGAPRARERIHPRNFGCNVSVLRPSIHSLGVREGNQVSARGGVGEYVIFYWRENVRCIGANRVYLAGNHARNGVAIVVAFKSLFTLGIIIHAFSPG